MTLILHPYPPSPQLLDLDQDGFITTDALLDFWAMQGGPRVKGQELEELMTEAGVTMVERRMIDCNAFEDLMFLRVYRDPKLWYR